MSRLNVNTAPTHTGTSPNFDQFLKENNNNNNRTSMACATLGESMATSTDIYTDSKSSDCLLSENGSSAFSVASSTDYDDTSLPDHPPPRPHKPLSQILRDNKEDLDSLLYQPGLDPSDTPGASDVHQRNYGQEIGRDGSFRNSDDNRYEVVSNRSRNNILRRRNLLVLGVVAMVMSSTAVVLMGIMLLQEKGWEDSIPSGVFRACVPKTYLAPNLRLSTEGDSYCARSNQEVSLLLELVIAEIKNITEKDEAEPKTAVGPPVSEKTSALCGLEFNGTCGKCGRPSPFNLTRCGKSTVNERGLHIHYDGFYYVFSEITLKMTTKGNDYCRLWRHYISRHRLNYPQNTGILASSLQDLGNNCSSASMTSFTGGIFKLQKGDDVSVHFCGECDDSKTFDAMTDDKTASYLGFYALSHDSS